MSEVTIPQLVLDTVTALKFSTGTDRTGQRLGRKNAVSKAVRHGSSRSGKVPPGDVRLIANVRKDLHLKLKIKSAQSRTTIGEIIEELVTRHL